MGAARMYARARDFECTRNSRPANTRRTCSGGACNRGCDKVAKRERMLSQRELSRKEGQELKKKWKVIILEKETTAVRFQKRIEMTQIAPVQGNSSAPP
jgi:hypothetical protein